MGHIWEDALTFIGSTADAKPATRESVRDDEKPWVNTDVRKVQVHDGFQGILEAGYSDVPLDSWVAWYFTYTVGAAAKEWHASYIIGTDVIYANLDGAGAKFAAFTASRAPLERFIDGTTKANDRLDPAGFAKAAKNLEDFTYFLDGWITKIGTAWVKGIGEEDGDWQGSSANALRALLLAFRNEIDADNRMIRLANVGSFLTPVKGILDTQLTALWKGFQAWWNSPLAWPTNAVTAALMEGVKDATLKIDSSERTPIWHSRQDIGNGTGATYGRADQLGKLKFTLTGAPFGDPSTVDFWKKVDKRAREIWVAHVVKMLDKTADDALTAIGTAYGNITNAATPLKPFPLIMPDAKTPSPDDPTKDPTKDGAPDTKDIGGGPDTKDIGGGPDTKDLGGGPDIKDIKGVGGGGGTGGDSGGLGGGSNKPNLDLGGIGGNSGSNNPNLNLGGGSGNLPNLNLGSGGSGSSGGNSGSGNGPNLIGNPFPDLNTGPLPDYLLPGAPGSSRPVVVPPTSIITKDGRIVDESGNPVLDAAGNPMVAGPGYTIGPDGVLRDGDGNTVSQSRQLLADRYSAAGDDSGADNLLSPNSFGSGGFSYNTMGLGAGGSGGGSSLGLGGGPMITGMGGGLSNRALAAGGDPNATKAVVDQANAERVAAERAARAAAQEQAALTGQRTATSSGGMPMMPPGGGMGGGAGGPGNDKERRRTTWLAEDEEVWGTDSGAVQGVIGR